MCGISKKESAPGKIERASFSSGLQVFFHTGGGLLGRTKVFDILKKSRLFWGGDNAKGGNAKENAGMARAASRRVGVSSNGVFKSTPGKGASKGVLR